MRVPTSARERLLEAKILSAQRRGGDKAVGARLSQTNEQSDPRDAGDPRFEARADMLAHMGGDEAVGGFAFGRHRPPLGA